MNDCIRLFVLSIDRHTTDLIVRRKKHTMRTFRLEDCSCLRAGAAHRKKSDQLRLKND